MKNEGVNIKNPPTVSVLKKLAERYPDYDIDPQNIEAWLFVGRVNGVCHNLFSKHFDKLKLTSARFSVLMRLRRNPTEMLNPSEISDYLGCTRATMSGLLDGLEDAQLVNRIDSNDDKRCCKVQLTPKGLKLIDRVAPEYLQEITQVFKGIKKNELKIFRKVLNELNEEITRRRSR